MLIVIGKVNRRLPADQEEISYFSWSMKKVNHLYKQFYPNGKLIIAAYILGILMILFGLAASYYA
jgi:hypothetical protein